MNDSDDVKVFGFWFVFSFALFFITLRTFAQ